MVKLKEPIVKPYKQTGGVESDERGEMRCMCDRGISFVRLLVDGSQSGGVSQQQEGRSRLR